MFEKRGYLRKHFIVAAVLFTLAMSVKTWGIGDNVTYVLDDSGTLTISGSGEMYDYTAGKPDNYPDSYSKYFTPSPFFNNSSVKRIIIKNGVTGIGDYMFCKCSGLTAVEIPNGITRIGKSAFGGCTNLETVNLPGSVTAINDSAFSNCTRLKNINIPGSVTTLGSSVFNACTSLAKIEIPPGIDEISGWTFENCSSLSDVVINSGVTSIHKDAFCACVSLKSIIIPSSVKNLYYYSFEKCSNLESIELPAGLSDIDAAAFYGCSKLTDVYYRGTQAQWNQIGISLDNENLTGAYIHYNSRLNQHTLVKTAAVAATETKAGNSAYWTCSYCGKHFSDENGTKMISRDSWVIPAKGSSGSSDKPGEENNGSIRKDTVLSNSTASYRVLADPETVTYKAPAKKTAKAVSVPASVKLNGKTYKVTAIAPNAFKGMKKLTKVTIGKNVRTIGKNAFYGCKKLKKITVKTTKLTSKTVGKNAFKGIHAKAVVTVPKKSLKAYKKWLPKKGLTKTAKIK